MDNQNQTNNQSVPTIPAIPANEGLDSQVSPRGIHSGIRIFFYVLIPILVVVTGFLYLQNRQLSKQISQIQATPTPEITPTPTEKMAQSDTSTWKTYTNTNLGFSLRYPLNWFLEEEGPLDFQNVRIQNYDPKTAEGRGYDPVADKGKFAINIELLRSAKPKTVDDLKKNLGLQGGPCLYMGDPAGTNIIFGEVVGKIGSYLTYTRNIRCSELPESTNDEILYLMDGKGGVISFIKFLDVASDVTTLNKILSTFKFTDITTTPTPTKTNTGSETGTVSGKLCYPSDFLPKGEIVAKDISSGAEKIYTQQYPGSRTDSTFRMTLPQGEYHLRYQAHASGNNPSLFTSLYYTPCAVSNYENCSDPESHMQISIKIDATDPKTNVMLCDELTPEQEKGF